MSAASVVALGFVAAPAIAGGLGATGQQTRPNQENQQSSDDPQNSDATDQPTIIVTGFRASLNAAINIKRDANSMVDAIVAEDIAKFPDQNLAESLQRIPGVTITRSGGEGKQISVRGLGPQFTRVRVNGMETLATDAGNGSRSFDFDIFASELFNNIVVHKSAEASLDEGSLGAVVDLNTGNPLSGRTGLTIAANAEGTYNSYGKKALPRVAGLISWKSPGGTIGASLSAAYSKTNVVEYGFDSGRWAQAPFDSVDGTPCWTTANTGGTYVPSTACDTAALAFHARIPRYWHSERDRKRLGITGSLQFAPTDATKISIDGLYSKFDEVQHFQTAEILFRGNERAIDLSDYQIDSNGTLVSGTFDDAWERHEHYLHETHNDFHQLSAHWDQDLGKQFHFSLMAGFSRAKGDSPVESTIMLDDRDSANFSYDYSDMRHPVVAFGGDPTDPSKYQISELRDTLSSVVNKYRTVSLQTQWRPNDNFQVETGGFYRRYNFDTERYDRNTVVCPSRDTAGPDIVLGTITCTPKSVFGPTAVYGYPATADLTQLVSIAGANPPSGTTTQYVVADLDSAAAYTGLYGLPAIPNAGGIRGVVERTKGGYLQFDGNGDLGFLRFKLNAGVRYVRTEQSSRGIVNGTDVVTVDRHYDDWLPSANLSLIPAENIIVRAAIAGVMTRPDLGSLTPGGSVDGFNYRVNFGNPYLKPYRATNYDLALEYYFHPGALASVALFRKEVTNFPLGQTVTGTFASTGLPLSTINASSPAATNPEGAPWSISTIINAGGAKLDGIELAFQTPFYFLPGALSNFGVAANATFVTSSAHYTVPGPATEPPSVPDGKLTLVPVNVTGNFLNLSRRTFNGTFYYEDKHLSARMSVAYRSKFLTGTGGNGGVLEGTDGTVYVDGKISYNLTRQITLSVNGLNLTNEPSYGFSDLASGRVGTSSYFGRTFTAGIRFKY